MPITEYPFKALRSGDVRRAFLPIRIYNPSNGQHLQSWGLIDTPIDFMPNLPLVLLGVNKFLSHFVLNMDYPRQRFSIKRPRS